MLLIVVTLKEEADPIIEHFKLKAFNDKRFNIWTNADIALVLSKVGKISASIATTYLATRFLSTINSFLNIGIAGHKNLKIGSCILAHKVNDPIIKKAHFPSIVFDLKIPSKEVITVDTPQKEYFKDLVYDMESFGFFETACKFSYFDLIHSLKIISDNEFSNVFDLSKEKISELIFQNLTTIENLAKILIKLSKSLTSTKDIDLKSLIEKFHLSEYEKYQIKNLIKNIKSLNEDFVLDNKLYKNFNTKKELIFYLQNLYKKIDLIL